MFSHMLIEPSLNHLPRPQQESWQEPTHLYHAQQSSWVPPSSFKLRTPPMGRHNRRSLVVTKSQGDAPGQEKENPRGQMEQRAQAVSRLKLLNAPSKGQEQVRKKVPFISQGTPVSGMLWYNMQGWLTE